MQPKNSYFVESYTSTTPFIRIIFQIVLSISYIKTRIFVYKIWNTLNVLKTKKPKFLWMDVLSGWHGFIDKQVHTNMLTEYFSSRGWVLCCLLNNVCEKTWTIRPLNKDVSNYRLPKISVLCIIYV